MSRRRLETAWLAYVKACKLDRHGVGPVQITETRRAFYAGAAAFFSELLGGLDHSTHPDTVTDLDMTCITGMHEELVEFAAAVDAEARAQDSARARRRQ